MRKVKVQHAERQPAAQPGVKQLCGTKRKTRNSKRKTQNANTNTNKQQLRGVERGP